MLRLFTALRCKFGHHDYQLYSQQVTSLLGTVTHHRVVCTHCGDCVYTESDTRPYCY